MPQARRGWLLVLALCVLPGLALATDEAPSADPPARVARLAFVSGDLGLLPAGAKDWTDAQVNRPLTTGDRLSSGNDARVAVDLGGAGLRMAGGSDVGILELDGQLAQFELTEGTVNLSVRDVAEGQTYEIDTPTVALVLDGPGVYRVDIDHDGGATSVTAFRGDATAYGENGVRQLLHAGSRYRFVDPDLKVVSVDDIRGQDAFDYWCADRDNAYASAEQQDERYLPDDMVGGAELDRYGQWESDADYGDVWYPDDVAADWAPYSDGRWIWMDPWGWTWVDDQPWGFAPFHYGRWAYVRGRWGWVPGPRGMRPVYAPALVAFVGGPNWRVSLGFGAAPVGWFPLGPGDIYFPWYRSSRDYYSRVNMHNLHDHGGRDHDHLRDRLAREYGVYQKPERLREIHYSNRHAPHAYTVVRSEDFAGGHRVRNARLRVDANALQQAPLVMDGAHLHLRPTAAARPAHTGALPVAGFHRTVVARHAPSAHPTRDANVRVLGTAMTAAHDRAAPAPAGHEPWRTRGSDRAAAVHTDVPAHERGRPQTLPDALPSARFAHSRSGAPARVEDARATRSRHESNQPPGVSFIAPADTHAERARSGRPTRPEDVPEFHAVRQQPAPAPQSRQPWRRDDHREAARAVEAPHPAPPPVRRETNEPRAWTRPEVQRRAPPAPVPAPREFRPPPAPHVAPQRAATPAPKQSAPRESSSDDSDRRHHHH